MSAAGWAKHALQRLVGRFGYRITRQPPPPPPGERSDDMAAHWARRLAAERPVEVVFDVGANRGQTIEWLRPLFPAATIHAFEPFPAPFAELKRLAESQPRIVAHPLALGERAGSAPFYEHSNDTTNSLLPDSAHIAEYAPGFMIQPRGQSTVTLERLDTFCRRQGIERIDVLKIDAQGYEKHILDGAGEMLRPDRIRSLLLEILFVEYYREQAWADDLIALLRARGYRLFGLSHVDFSPDRGWNWADAMFVGV